jgi:outer membrane protein TolC
MHYAMIHCSFAGSLLCLLAAGASCPAEETTLPVAYELSAERSESLQISVAEWRAAEARYRRAVGPKWPSLAAAGDAKWDEDGNSRLAGIGASWTVFDGFRTARDAEARQADSRAGSLDVEQARLLLYQDVADVFYQCLSFQGQREASREQLKALEDRAAELQRRVRLGRSKRSDLLATSNQMAEARLTIEQSSQSYAAALELLAFLTGTPAADLQPADQSPLPAAGDVDKYLAAAADRPDHKAGAARVEAARADEKAAKADRAPKVTLGGNAYPLRDPSDQSGWDLVLRAELPLFDGGARSARAAEAKQQLRISELRLTELRRSSERDVRQAYQSVFYGLRQWSELQTALGIAADTHESIRKDYEIGRANNLDVMAATLQIWGLRRLEAALGSQLRADMIHLHIAAGRTTP